MDTERSPPYRRNMDTDPRGDNDDLQVTENFEGTAVSQHGTVTNVFSGTANTLITAGDVDGDITIDGGGIQIGGKPAVPRDRDTGMDR